ncbi:MAG: peptidoglycan endopeptidase, partial [Laribacter sp.]|nr:peptidoglycan endopeptidase [Laribacter sp.]MBP9528628.1 peptidoglycan endopeptidase [Laribacter sp.]
MKFAFRPVAATLLASLALALTSPARASETAAKPRAETRLSSPGDEAMGDIILQAMSLMGIAYRFGGN